MKKRFNAVSQTLRISGRLTDAVARQKSEAGIILMWWQKLKSGAESERAKTVVLIILLAAWDVVYIYIKKEFFGLQASDMKSHSVLVETSSLYLQPAFTSAALAETIWPRISVIECRVKWQSLQSLNLNHNLRWIGRRQINQQVLSPNN